MIFNTIARSNVAKVLLIIFLVLFAFWLWIYMQALTEGPYNNLFGALYPIISLIGGFYGIFVVAKKWGGLKSLMGRGVLFLSLGLLAEVFGQWAWSFYTIVLQIEIPYPSIADLGYFAIIPLYSYAMYNLARAAGVKIGLRSFAGKTQAIVIPLMMIGVAYFIFLRNIEIDLSAPLRTFLDFGYPGLEPIAVSIGILTYSLSRGVLGGMMRPKILFIIFALVFQYITDYMFLYRVGVGAYYNGGVVDLMYAASFLIMSIGIITMYYTEDKISQT